MGGGDSDAQNVRVLRNSKIEQYVGSGVIEDILVFSYT